MTKQDDLILWYIENHYTPEELIELLQLNIVQLLEYVSEDLLENTLVRNIILNKLEEENVDDA